MNQSEEELEIVTSEVRYAINTVNTTKGPHPDYIPFELLKQLDENNISTMVKLFSEISQAGVNFFQYLGNYATGQIDSDKPIRHIIKVARSITFTKMKSHFCNDDIKAAIEDGETQHMASALVRY